MSTPKIFYDALAARTGAEVIAGSESKSGKQLRFMIRVAAGPSTVIWLGIVRHLLRFTAKADVDWTLDISKQYFVTPSEDLRYGWRIIVQATKSSELSDTILTKLAHLVKTVEVKGAQIEEVRLNGSPNRKRGGYTDRVMVGPLAVRG